MEVEMYAKVCCCLMIAGLLAGCGGPEEVTAPRHQGLENGSFAATLNGFEIHYEVHGQGPVVMTLPNSWGLSLAALRAFYRPLEERLTMVYFDPRGMGESDPIREDADMSMAAVRADFDALRQHLGLTQVNAIGWSNGASNLILLAAAYPETLSSVVFLHGLACFSEEDLADFAESYPEIFEKYNAFLAEVADESMPVEEKTARQRSLWLEEYFPAITADPEASRAAVQELFSEAELSWAHVAYNNQEAANFDARDRLPKITAKSLVIAGTHDAISMARSQELADGIKDAMLVVFDKSGHFAPIEEPELFKATVFSFLGVG
jgi:proline iminopeptidase